MFRINTAERGALAGLPYLQRVLYYEGLRPYMDYSTGIVGLKRGISYQSLSEVAYIEPHRGYPTGSPLKGQIRRALSGLQKVGLILKMDSSDKLIFKCLLADQDNFVQNKVGTKAAQQADTKAYPKNSEFLRVSENIDKKADPPKSVKAGTPPVSGNINKKTHISANFIFSKKIFEEANAENLLNLDDENTRRDFIAFHQSRGTLSCNWDAEYIRWLLKRKKYQQEEKGNVARKNHSSHHRQGFLSAVDIVKQANAERFKKPHGRLIDG